MTDSEPTKANRQVSAHHRRVLRQRARRMRHEPTQSEWLLWQALRLCQLGVAFRRQVVLQGYIADFYSSQARLIVEVDGVWHASRRLDIRRDRALACAGYRILRVSAEEVLVSLPSVVAKVRATL